MPAYQARARGDLPVLEVAEEVALELVVFLPWCGVAHLHATPAAHGQVGPRGTNGYYQEFTNAQWTIYTTATKAIAVTHPLVVVARGT